MDKLMNASNASNTDNSFKDGEYVFYVIKESDDKSGYVLRFMGDSPKSKHKINVALSICEHYKKLDGSTSNPGEKDKYMPESLLDNLYECEEPGHCVVRNGTFYIRRLHSVKNLVKKRVMMLSVGPEVITEDMGTYRLPEYNCDTGVGTVQWFLNKYADKRSGYNVLNAFLYNDALVDLEWSRDIPTRHNLLDRLQYFTQNVGWTPEEIISYLGTGNIKTEDGGHIVYVTRELDDGLTELENDTTGRKRLYSSNMHNGECIMNTAERGYFITDGTYLGRSVEEAMKTILEFPWAHSALWELAVLEKELW